MEKTKNGNTVNKALLMGTALISLSAVDLQKAQAATGTGAMSAVILAPITVSGTVALDFGAMTETGAGGTMTMDRANTRTPGGAVVGVASNVGASGVVSLTAATGVPIDLSLAAASYTVSDGLANTMVVDNFDLGGGAGVAITVTAVAATTTIPLGARLTVGAGQVAGTYTGAYTLNANYQ